MTLDLWNAEARGRIETASGSVDWRAVVVAEDMLLVVETTARDEARDTLRRRSPERRDRWNL